jgi:hypothetical protein
MVIIRSTSSTRKRTARPIRTVCKDPEAANRRIVLADTFNTAATSVTVSRG